MQVFKLVRPGIVDAIIGFDELPESLLEGVRRGPIAGFPRHWRDFMNVKNGDTTAQPFYLMDYLTRNADREKWQEIVSYVKRNVDPSVRLLDKVEAMARPLSLDSHSDLTLEPEEVPIIPLPKVTAQAPTVADALAEDAEPKRRGRRPKSEVAV